MNLNKEFEYTEARAHLSEVGASSSGEAEGRAARAEATIRSHERVLSELNQKMRRLTLHVSELTETEFKDLAYAAFCQESWLRYNGMPKELIEQGMWAGISYEVVDGPQEVAS